MILPQNHVAANHQILAANVTRGLISFSAAISLLGPRQPSLHSLCLAYSG